MRCEPELRWQPLFYKSAIFGWFVLCVCTEQDLNQIKDFGVCNQIKDFGVCVRVVHQTVGKGGGVYRRVSSGPDDTNFGIGVRCESVLEVLL